MKTTEYICTHCRKRFKNPTVIYNRHVTAAPEKYQKSYGCPICGYEGIEEIRSLRATKNELRRYLLLCREVEKESTRLTAMKARGEDTSELYELIENNKLRCTALMLKTQQFIYSIDDSLMRQIFELRYLKGMKWSGVAAGLGGFYSQDYVRITHDRYLKARCGDVITENET